MVKQREGYRAIIIEPAKTWREQGLCCGCGKPKVEWTRRKDWKCCSTECTDKYVKNCLFLGWEDVRKKIFERDNYTCKMCGVTPKVFKDSKPYQDEHGGWHWDKIEIDQTDLQFYRRAKENLDADHIKPIALEGEEWDFENIQTLCKACHKIKTRADIKQIAILRKQEKLKVKGQQIFAAPKSYEANFTVESDDFKTFPQKVNTLEAIQKMNEMGRTPTDLLLHPSALAKEIDTFCGLKIIRSAFVPENSFYIIQRCENNCLFRPVESGSEMVCIKCGMRYHAQ